MSAGFFTDGDRFLANALFDAAARNIVATGGTESTVSGYKYTLLLQLATLVSQSLL